MTITKKYRLLKDLLMYPSGTVITHTFEELPSQYNSGIYETDGSWTDKDKVNVTLYLQYLIKWCISSQRTDDNHKDWVEELSDDRT